MAHLSATDRTANHQLASVFGIFEGAMGFLPNSVLTMAHMPQLPAAFLMLSSVVFGADLRGIVGALKDAIPDPGAAEDNLPPVLVQLIAFAVSTAAGCRYCQAHTSHSAHNLGEEAEKLAEILHFETSPLFSDAERAAIAIAFAAGQVPNEATESHFQALTAHYSDRQITQIVGVIAMFGFLNRWNDTMATTLEENPVSYALQNLDAIDWQLGKHRSDDAVDGAVDGVRDGENNGAT
jgi:AhpD family alkylhydroperoxidase